MIRILLLLLLEIQEASAKGLWGGRGWCAANIEPRRNVVVDYRWSHKRRLPGVIGARRHWSSLLLLLLLLRV